jgi:hypothetical protein
MNISIERIEAMIYSIRGTRVMLDSDLAKLYGVETKVLNQAVKRNFNRFPNDFLIIPNSSELANLQSQIVTANPLSHWNHKRRSLPMLFTENGVAMLSSVLHSEQAIEINIAIMRTFTKLRSFLSLDTSSKITEIEINSQKIFKIVFERLDNLENKLDTYIEAVTPKLPDNRKKIGFKK